MCWNPRLWRKSRPVLCELTYMGLHLVLYNNNVGICLLKIAFSHCWKSDDHMLLGMKLQTLTDHTFATSWILWLYLWTINCTHSSWHLCLLLFRDYILFCSEITLFPSLSFRLQAQLVMVCYTAKTRDPVIFIRVSHCNNLCTVVVCTLLLLGGVFLLLLLSFWFIPLLRKMSYKKNKFVSQIQNNESYFS